MSQTRVGFGNIPERCACFAMICLGAALTFDALSGADTGPNPGDADPDTLEIETTFDSYTRQLVRDRLLAGDESQPPAGARTVQAYKLLVLASRQEDTDALSSLTRILSLDLPGSPQTDKILAGTHRRLSDLFSHSNAKRLHHLVLAAQYATGADRRDLENRIEELGGDPFALTFDRAGVAGPLRTPGVNDTCDQSLHVALDYSDTAVDVAGGGDHNWVSFDVVTGDPTVAQSIRIETSSNDAISFDDTDLTLYGGCEAGAGPGDGVPTGFIAFDDDGGSEFMSLIEEDCLGEGTYYLEVGGFADVSPADNFTLEIQVVTEGCSVRVPDAFEPDDDRAAATDAPDEPQAHSIFPTGDNDMVTFQLQENSMMRLATARRFPVELLTEAHEDTVVELFYDEPKDYGGYCNTTLLHQPPYPCLISDNGADCSPDLQPHPNDPICIPYYRGYGPINPWPEDNALTQNDDADIGFDFGSEIEVCLPRTDEANRASAINKRDFDWYLNVRPFGDTDFDYELIVDDAGSCRFEQEPNNSLGLFPAASSDSQPPPNALIPGESIHGINEFSVARAVLYGLDVDVFSFDVESPTVLTFETITPEPFGHDTTLDIYVGPDRKGDFFHTGLSDDNGGVGLLSKITAGFPPACEFLGTCAAGQRTSRLTDTDYFIAVSTTARFPDFPYELRSSIEGPGVADSEPNDLCPIEAQPIEVGDTLIGSVGVSCDFDTYGFSLAENTRVSFETSERGESADSVMELTDGSCRRIGCDDDGGDGTMSALESCLPPGHYQLRLRGADPSQRFDYTLETSGAPGCVPNDPPTTTGDDLFVCTRAFDVCESIEPDFVEDPSDDVADCGIGLQFVHVGDRIAASVNASCDYDAFLFSVGPGHRQVEFLAEGGDLAIQLEDSDCLYGGQGPTSQTKIACDDDSGSGGASPYHPRLSGCLRQGGYVLRVRPSNPGEAFDYTVHLAVTGSCINPAISGDEGLACLGFSTCEAP